MKKLDTLSNRTFLKIFFLCFSLCFLIAAVCMPDRGEMFSGLIKIYTNPAKVPTNYFSVGGFAATFLNMGITGLICTALYAIPGKKADNAATLATILTVGFAAWGINLANMWPTVLGVVLYCIVRKEKLGDNTTAMLFSTGLAPFISELMLRYPNAEVTGFSFGGVIAAVIVGIVVGFFLPAGLEFSPRVHKGFDLYSAALPVGMTAFLLNTVLYKAMGLSVPDLVSDISVSSNLICNIFCISLFALCIIVALIAGCTPRKYWSLLRDPDVVTNVTSSYGNSVMLMNTGLFGLFIILYYNLIGADFNGVTLGVVFCMLCTCNSGSHPGNVWPIMLGYAIISTVFRLISPVLGGEFTQFLNNQSIIIGLCYANGLSPISDRYGWVYGMAAAMLHYCIVTTVPQLHGGMCLYNGGFTAALVCVLFVPILEKLARTKGERHELVHK